MNGLFEWSFLGAAVGATATDGVEGPFGAVLGAGAALPAAGAPPPKTAHAPAPSVGMTVLLGSTRFCVPSTTRSAHNSAATAWSGWSAKLHGLAVSGSCRVRTCAMMRRGAKLGLMVHAPN